MDQVAQRTDRLGQSSAAPAPEAPSAWAQVVGRYLEALRVTHYAPDTVHVRTLYLKYFTAWATAHGIAKPEDITRGDVERYQVWLYHYRKRTGGPLSEPARAARRRERPLSLAGPAACARREPGG